MKSTILSQLYEFMLSKQYSKRTISSYLRWIEQYLSYHNNAAPKDLGGQDIKAFLSYLAIHKNVSPATQAQALNAVNFLYNKFLNTPTDPIDDFHVATKTTPVPTALTEREVGLLLNQVPPKMRLPIALIYGSGLRRIEVARLRIGDIDFKSMTLKVWLGNGANYRTATLSPAVVDGLKQQIKRAKAVFEKDQSIPCIQAVPILPVHAKQHPNAASSLEWQYLFPAKRLSIDAESGYTRRHHIDESAINKCVRKAAKAVGIDKQVSSHALRYSFAAHLLERGADMRDVEEQLGQCQLATSEMYAHLIQHREHQITSPLNNLSVSF